MKKKKCAFCGKYFLTLRASTCSDACRQGVRLRRKALAKAQEIAPIEEVVTWSLDEKLRWLKLMNDAGHKVTYADIQRISTDRMLKEPEKDKPIKEEIPFYDEDLLMDNIMYLVQASGSSVTGAARCIGITPDLFARNLRGVTRMSIESMIRVANYYQISVETLLSEELNPNGGISK